MKKSSKAKSKNVKSTKELCHNCKPAGVCKNNAPSKLSQVLTFFFNKVGGK